MVSSHAYHPCIPGSTIISSSFTQVRPTSTIGHYTCVKGEYTADDGDFLESQTHHHEGYAEEEICSETAGEA